jgi:energy-coupling factor transporter transmembrane protein EcfT
VSEEAQRLDRQAAYVDTVRGMAKRERDAGFVACLIGVLLLVWARFVAGAPQIMLWAGLTVIAAGWGLLAWSVFKRVTWVRAHPFESGE